ncbi:MAG TPA: DNA polymerase III subunit delta [Opitutaceae bacterium]|nr:DNA polymerase III subunit delta [Opitutaceae bacterium]
MAHAFTFICGADDYLVGRMAQERFAEVAKEITDEFSREVINGFAVNVAEVEAAINRFRESVQTVAMFGGQRAVWLKDVNFLADTVTGRAESTLKQVEVLQELLQKIIPAETAVVISAAPVDRRRAFLKWCEKNADFSLVGGDTDGSGFGLEQVVLSEAKNLGVVFSPDALALLLARVGANTRLLVEEVRKLATFVGDGLTIEEDNVAELTANVAEGDFFEGAEAFFSGNLGRTLDAFHRHFFSGGDARPLLSALQNRNRILLQIRALIDAGDVRLGPRGLDQAGFSQAAQRYATAFTGAPEKSSYNLFTQNPWYLGKLAGSAKLPALRRLIDNQQEFIRAFEEIISRPQEQEDVLRDLAVRCLT